ILFLTSSISNSLTPNFGFQAISPNTQTRPLQRKPRFFNFAPFGYSQYQNYGIFNEIRNNFIIITDFFLAISTLVQGVLSSSHSRGNFFFLGLAGCLRQVAPRGVSQNFLTKPRLILETRPFE